MFRCAQGRSIYFVCRRLFPLHREDGNGRSDLEDLCGFAIGRFAGCGATRYRATVGCRHFRKTRAG
ncbi:hypothetical protein Pcar_2985 [Syntrophotalea carbinolica DSM 2380]|uniref:Uncharacterized protein n=1 Tax=Syntrophotalea carbinolica (strain DSM 2380 / NBRC 103641 / GraBd1) TaxID=338963 RepID=Q3A087_SYNC1|nr:hypothetical protein Pcar_2985 [Syntrophotalea carbinolica DSM 2380]